MEVPRRFASRDDWQKELTFALTHDYKSSRSIKIVISDRIAYPVHICSGRGWFALVSAVPAEGDIFGFIHHLSPAVEDLHAKRSELVGLADGFEHIVEAVPVRGEGIGKKDQLTRGFFRRGWRRRGWLNPLLLGLY